MKNNITKTESIENKLIAIRGRYVILDSDVASIYGVETRRINEAVKNNSEKFPAGYIFPIDKNTKNELVENFDRFRMLKHSSITPKAFTEKGLYMLATILKSPKATETTLAIIETFAKVRELNRAIASASDTTDEVAQKEMIKRTGEIMSDLLSPGLSVSGTETSIELNLALMKIKHVVKRDKK